MPYRAVAAEADRGDRVPGRVLVASHRKKLAVLQVGKLYSPYIGGVEQVVKTIAEGLRDVVTMRVLVCNTRPVTERAFVNGVDVTRAASLGLAYSMPLSGSFFAEFRRASKSADILQFHMPFPLGDLAGLLFRRRGKVVVWWHSEVVRQRVFAMLYAPLMKLFLRKATKIVVATPNHVRYTPALAPHKDKCVVIPFGIDTRKYELTDEIRIRADAIRQMHGTPLAVFVGRLVYYKGVETLVRAMADVSGHLIIIGDGPLEPRLRAMVAVLGIQSRVSFVGVVSDEDLLAYFHACDVLVLPSVARSEAFGLVQLEAMACGKPVINTRIETGVPSVSVDGQTGITVSPGDPGELAAAMNALFQNHGMRETYGRNALARVRERYNVSMMLTSLVRLYESIA